MRHASRLRPGLRAPSFRDMRSFSTSGRCGLAALACAAALLVASCAAPGPTGYRGLTGKFGYVDERVGDDTWRVVYYANTETPRTRVDQLALYRAAELARERGARHFAVMEKDFEREEEQRSIRDAPPPGFETAGAGMGSEATLSVTRDDRRLDERAVSVRLRSELLVRPYDAAPPSGAMRLYDTETVLRQLGPVVRGARQ